MDIFLYLPVAQVSINIFTLFGLGIFVGFLSGLFGVGGGFLLTPLLIMIGIPPTVAAATDSNQIVAASSSGMYAHLQRGNVDIKMGLLLLIGGVAGGTAGVQLIKILRHTGNADFLIMICYVIMLGTIGTFMFQESIRSLRPKAAKASEPKKEGINWFTKINNALPLVIHFEKSGTSMSVFFPLILGVMVGVLSAIMGVGGGFIMVPIMVYLLRMPMHVVVGTSLFQILFTCINVTFMQAYTNHTVDFLLALILLLGSTIGAQFGAKLSDKLKADHLKVLLASIVLLVMFKMLFDLLSTPELLLSLKGGH